MIYIPKKTRKPVPLALHGKKLLLVMDNNRLYIKGMINLSGYDTWRIMAWLDKYQKWLEYRRYRDSNSALNRIFKQRYTSK